MANDVIITPATGLVEFKDNNVLKGSIYESAGDIVINPVTGSVVLGDGTPANIIVGGVGVPVNITLQGGGNLSSNTNTLGIGVNGDTVNFTVTGVTYNWPTTLMRTADYTATDILTRLKTVDGTGSGLDADLLDGLNSTAFAQLSGATFTGAISGTSLTLSGDLIVNGTTTTINSTTLTVDDKNIELGSVTTPTDTTADGGGITLRGATDKTFNWVSATGYWTSNQSISAPRFVSTQVTGTAPLVVASTTLVTNLNADLLDGLNSATTNTASTIVARDGSGNFAAGTITAALSGNATTATTATYLNSAQSSSTKANITTRTESGFWESNTTTIANGWPETSASWFHLLSSTHSNGANYYSMQFAGSFYDSNALYYRATNGSGTTVWNKLWHAGNDGTGSGLDADLLDGYNVGTSGGTIPLLNTANTWSATQTIPTLAGNTQITGGLTISGSVASGAGDMGGYRGAGTNLVLKGDSVGRSGIFFESEKDGVNINHASDYGFIQFHPYGLDGSVGESNRLVIGVANDLDDFVVLQAPSRNGLKFSFQDATSGSAMPLYNVYHEGNFPDYTVLNDIADQFDGSKTVFDLRVEQTAVTSFVDSKELEVVIGGQRLNPYVDTLTYPWLSPYDSFKGFRVRSGQVTIYNAPYVGDSSHISYRRVSVSRQKRRYPFSAATIAFGD